jgi:hypothetical protein
MSTRILIKTSLNVGEFIGNSRIDDSPIRAVDAYQLNDLDPVDYFIIPSLTNPVETSIANTIDLNNIKKKYLK